MALLESSNFRASPGKLVMGLVTVNSEGRQLSFYKATLRNMVKWSPLFFSVKVIFIWFFIIGVSVWLTWTTIYDWLVKSDVVCRPSYFKMRYRSHDRIY
jgi:uncharacterized RDD family membrane protein YckC